jgi:uncharacterized small protein (TIGR04563 family)
MNDKRKKSIYMPEELLREIEAEAERLDRSDSYLLQLAWRMARMKIRAIPAVEVV